MAPRARKPLRVCVVTGTRAEYGLLRAVMAALKRDRAFELKVVASAMHLVREFGLTYREIEADGFRIDAKVHMLEDGDTPAAAAKSMGVGIGGFVGAYRRLAPDLVMLLGDRFEALAAASTALIMGIPIAHLSGGDVTEGAFDDAIRHAITKMAHLHFTASRQSAARVRQMGEEPRRVFAVGDPGLDSLRTMKLLPRGALERELGFGFRKRNLLVTFHPVTLDRVPSTQQFSVLLEALAAFGPDVGLLFTKPNADPEGRALIAALEKFAKCHANAAAFASLGHKRYLSVMAICDAVVGNSSSGLLEAPSLRKPAVNIGSRQAGRLRAKTVIDCPVDAAAIKRAIAKAFSMKVARVANPYGDGHAAERIVGILKRIDDPKALLRKSFRNLEVARG
jgi:UDP-hydrolysing UDP-N-acetyl-D-glucosamine 2-epimerase